MFADRTRWQTALNALSQRRQRLEREGVTLLDLTESNPTKVGFHYPPGWLSLLAEQEGLQYDPSPKGLLSAREAVASIYARKGVSLHPERIVLTASTSEAYGFLFRLLCNPGDQILIPVPSYPLFSYLADLSDVKPVSYPLRYVDRWGIDFKALEEAISSRTRAVIVVHPNNPTGSCVTVQEQERLAQLCRAGNIVLIADEVFSEYRFHDDRNYPSTLFPSRDLDFLTFSLGGISKFIGLPQMKLAWIAAGGPETLLKPALERLEVIADTFLSVNTPVQRALPQWLSNARGIQSQIQERISENRQFLTKNLKGRGVQLLQADGGWSAVLKIPSVEDEESWAMKLLEKERLLVYPGYFFDFPEPGIGVISLLLSPEIFQEGVSRLFRQTVVQ